jgi:hypothetical protein
LGSRANVDALILAALVELFPGDRVVVIWVIIDTLLMGIAAVIK